MGDLPGTLGSREFSPHRDMQVRGLASTLKIFLRFYKVIVPDLLAARDIVNDVFAEALNTREFGAQREKPQARSAPKVPSETVARDGAGDDFIAALL